MGHPQSPQTADRPRTTACPPDVLRTAGGWHRPRSRALLSPATTPKPQRKAARKRLRPLQQRLAISAQRSESPTSKDCGNAGKSPATPPWNGRVGRSGSTCAATSNEGQRSPGTQATPQRMAATRNAGGGAGLPASPRRTGGSASRAETSLPNCSAAMVQLEAERQRRAETAERQAVLSGEHSTIPMAFGEWLQHSDHQDHSHFQRTADESWTAHPGNASRRCFGRS